MTRSNMIHGVEATAADVIFYAIDEYFGGELTRDDVDVVLTNYGVDLMDVDDDDFDECLGNAAWMMQFGDHVLAAA